jgi:hypothetical protein
MLLFFVNARFDFARLGSVGCLTVFSHFTIVEDIVSKIKASNSDG